MNHQRNNNNDGMPWAIIGIIILLVIGWGVSEIFGIDLSSAMQMILNLVLWSSFALGLFYFLGEEFISIFWPVLLGLLACCFFPVLNYHASHAFPAFFDPERVVWWGAWYTKLIAVFALTGLGFVGNYFFQDRH